MWPAFYSERESASYYRLYGNVEINTLHLHLVDDNGWRIEIKRYPLLTEIGSRRVDRPGKSFPERRNPRQGEPTVEKDFTHRRISVR